MRASQIIAQRMCELARKEALAREARDLRKTYALQDEGQQLFGAWWDARRYESGEMKSGT